MNKKQITVAAILMLGLLMSGCSQITILEKQNDGSYSTSKHLVSQASLPDRTFICEEDYMIATEFHNVTYAWPQGIGRISANFDEISFKSNNISCSVVERQLNINGRPAGRFKKGNRVGITSDGRVFVNGVELDSPGGI